ncbi:MAG: glycine cleavage system aminomethyltransferase GcvT [Zetaproteobacteria bacterium]|nr:glycine cleavage system aminomethyltransferase GcvT [Zetaproteobacteria bacterium]
MVEKLEHTSLFACHKQNNAHFISFSGWEMPFRYKPRGVVAEHHHVRTHLGLFDVSHMGQIFVAGTEAAPFLNYVCVSDIDKCLPGQGMYTVMCYDDGGTVDDLYVYRLTEQEFLLCVNAARVDADWQRLLELRQLLGYADTECQLRNESMEWDQLALQGPDSFKLLAALAQASPSYQPLLELEFGHICQLYEHSTLTYCARTGYTGELGVEFYVQKPGGELLWQQLVQAAASHDLPLVPIGLGARDTLRLESCYCLYGNELSAQISPLEAALGWLVDFEKDDFAGKNALQLLKQRGVPRRSIALKVKDKGVLRQGMRVLTLQGEELGFITSGGVFPSVGGAGGLALVTANMVKAGELVCVEVRGERKHAEVVKRPFYPSRAKDIVS